MSRLVSLDFLRFIAVLLVIGRHSFPLYQWAYGPIAFISDFFKSVGYLGVDLFFVISGFLVSGLLFKEIKETGRVRIIRFYIRRGFKIYPSFYIFLIASIFLLRPESNFLGEIFFLQNYIGGVWYHTWSLAVEEHFYLILPVLLVLIRPKLIPLLFPFLAILTLAGRTAFGDGLMFETHFRIDALFFGVLLSYHHNFGSLDSIRSRAWVLFSIVLLLCAVCVPLAYTYTLAYLGFGILMVNILNLDVRAIRPFAYIGKHSYSIYLWHEPVRLLVLAAIPSDFEERLLVNVIYIILSFVVGISCAKIIEFPFLKLRDAVFARRRPVLADAVA